MSVPQGVYVDTFYGLMDRFLISRGHKLPYERIGEPNFWEDIQERVIGETIGPEWKFDALIVDEGQDFEPQWSEILRLFLKPDADLLWLDDPDQAIRLDKANNSSSEPAYKSLASSFCWFPCSGQLSFARNDRALHPACVALRFSAQQSTARTWRRGCHLRWLRDETFVKRPEAVHKRCLVLWNKYVATIAGRPKLELTVPNNRVTYCVEWSELPAALREDTEAWLAHLAEADPMSLDGPAWPARPATINTRRFQVRQLISALVRRGHDISEFEALRDLVDPTVAKEALRFFHERNGKTTSSQIAGLVAVVFIIAKYWCKLDGEPLEQLALLKRKLAYRVKGMTSKNRDRLRQFTDRRNIEALIHFPQTVYDAVSGRNGISIANCLDMQVAVAVEMLLMMPVRRANLVRLRFGPEGHIRPRQDRKGTTHIVINGREVKNREDLEYPLPRESSDLLEIYIKRFRPILAKSPSYWVFPGEGPSGHKVLDQFSRQFKKTVRKWTGLDVNIHLMRHIGAKLYLDENPGAYEVVRRILGHKSLSTTVNNYTGLEIEAAVKHFDAVILGIRDAIGRSVGNA